MSTISKPTAAVKSIITRDTILLEEKTGNIYQSLVAISKRAKSDAYECGIEPSPQAAGGGRFPVKYFLTAMLFIVFDIEIVFLYPWAVAFDQLGLFGLVEMALFIGTVFVAYAYVWRLGGLEWD